MPPVAKPTRVVVGIERLNANENRLSYNRNSPRRIVILVRRGSAVYAVKMFGPWSLRHVREVQVYSTLTRSKAFPSDFMVRMAGAGTVRVPITTPPKTIVLKIEGQNVHVDLSPSQARTISRAFRLYMSRHAIAVTPSIQARYFVTQIHPGYKEWSVWERRMRSVSAKTLQQAKTAVGLALTEAVVRAHVATGFAHVDLHPQNILARVSTNGTGGTSAKVKLFDFDLSYVPATPRVTQTAEKAKGDPTDLHLWYYAGLQQSNRARMASFRSYAIVHDLARIVRWFAKRGDTGFANRMVERVKNVPGLNVDAFRDAARYAQAVAFRHWAGEGVFSYGDAFAERIASGAPPFPLRAKRKKQ